MAVSPVLSIEGAERVLTAPALAFVEDLTRCFRPRMRPRGFHLVERHCLVDDRPAPGMLFDFGMFLFHNAEALARAGTGPYFYLPKMQSHLEARLWNDVFLHAQAALKIPIKDDPEANERAMEKVRADKLRELREGHHGTWVAHPGLVGIAKRIFDEGMPGPKQLDRLRDDVSDNALAMLEAPLGPRTEAGLRHNIRVGIQYLEAWLGGQGAVPIYNLMEDAGHRGNLAPADLAVTPTSRRARRWPNGDASAGRTAHRRRASCVFGKKSDRNASSAAGSARHARCSNRSRRPTSCRSF